MAEQNRTIDLTINTRKGDTSGLEATTAKAQATIEALKKLDAQARQTFQTLHELQQKERLQGGLTPQDQRRLTMARQQWQAQQAQPAGRYEEVTRPWAIGQFGTQAVQAAELGTMPGLPVYTRRGGAAALARALRSPAAAQAPVLSPSSSAGAEALARAVSREQSYRKQADAAQESTNLTQLRQRMMAGTDLRLPAPLGTGESSMGLLRQLRWSNADAAEREARDRVRSEAVEAARTSRAETRARHIEDHQGMLATRRLREVAQRSGEQPLFPGLPRMMTPGEQARATFGRQREQSRGYLESLRWKPEEVEEVEEETPEGDEEDMPVARTLPWATRGGWGQTPPRGPGLWQRVRGRLPQIPRLPGAPMQVGQTTFASPGVARAWLAAQVAAAGGGGGAAGGGGPGGAAGGVPPTGGGAGPVPPGGAPFGGTPGAGTAAGGGGAAGLASMLGGGGALASIIGRIPVIGPFAGAISKWGVGRGLAAGAGIYAATQIPTAMAMYEEKALGVMRIGQMLESRLEQNGETIVDSFRDVDASLVGLRKNFSMLPHEALPAMAMLARATGSIRGVEQAARFSYNYGVPVTEAADMQARATRLLAPGADVNRMAAGTPMYWDPQRAQLMPQSRAGFVEQALQVGGVGGYMAPLMSQDWASNVASFFSLGQRYTGQQASAFGQFAQGVQTTQSDPIQSLRFRAIGRLAERMGDERLQIGAEDSVDLRQWRGRRQAAQMAANSPEVLQAYAEEALRYAGGNEELARDLFQGIMGQENIAFSDKIFNKWRYNPQGFNEWAQKELPKELADQEATRRQTAGRATEGGEILAGQAKWGEVLLDLGAVTSKAVREMQEVFGDLYSKSKDAIKGVGDVGTGLSDLATGFTSVKEATWKMVDGMEKVAGLLETLGRLAGLGPLIDRIPGGWEDDMARDMQSRQPGTLTIPQRSPWSQPSPPAVTQPQRPQ